MREGDGEGPGESAFAFEVALEWSFFLLNLLGDLLILRYMGHEVINYGGDGSSSHLYASANQHLRGHSQLNYIIPSRFLPHFYIDFYIPVKNV